ncbi:MAG: SDR family NAD(P)-dependent oxidoreductase, partial [Muribaculaceae bacterium]|nr:SDR family NAD(P)-dependent oxidoreductase [Muribaculaceae bacterium]
MQNLFDIKGNVTVITGGTGVLGRAIARYLAHEGAKVIILGRKEQVGREIVESVMAEKPAGSIEFMHTDVMDARLLEANRDAILERYGRIDTLLNAAGGNQKGATIAPDQNFFDLDPE